jgi:hydrogenase maturation protease
VTDTLRASNAPKHESAAPTEFPTLLTGRLRSVAPKLVIGIGNPSRGDDALGPELLERLRARNPSDVDLVEDFQLQPEHVLDLVGREEVIVVDADASGVAPFRFSPVIPDADRGVSTHALSPGALLDVYRQVVAAPMPPTWLLAIRGYSFELGAPLGDQARANLDAAVALLAGRFVA